MDQDEIEVHKNAKKEQDQHPASLVNKEFEFAGTKWAILSGQVRPNLPAWVTNQNTGFVCLLAEPAI